MMIDKLQLHRAFWEGQLPRPLLGTFYPARTALPDYPPFDFDLSDHDLIAKNKAWVQALQGRPDDRIMPAFVNFGISLLTALAGGRFEFDGYTTWTVPVASSVEQLTITGLDEDLPLWRDYLHKLRVLRDAEIADTMVGLADMTGPLDMLAGLTGTEQLCVDMMNNPQAVRHALEQCRGVWLAVYQAHVRELGLQYGGMLNVFQIFTPGRGALWSEDFSALIGPNLYECTGREEDAAIAGHLDCTFMHIHSAAGACLKHISTIPSLNGIEISNDPNGPPLEQIIAWARHAQDEGKSVILSNYDKLLRDDDIDMILTELDHQRLCLNLQCSDEGQAWDYYERFTARV